MLTLKEFFEKTQGKEIDKIAGLFSFILDEVCRDKRDVINYLTLGQGSIINEDIGIEFPESKGFFKDEEGYIEKGMELYLIYSGRMKNELSEVTSFFIDEEGTYRYLRLFYNTYVIKYPDDKEGRVELEEAYKYYREKYNIPEEDPNFDYYDVIGNIYKYVKWYWDTNRWEE